MTAPRRLRLLVDPGHGGRDNGAVANGLVEAELVLEVAAELVEALAAAKAPVDVSLTRTGEPLDRLTLAGRDMIAEDLDADLVLSLHANASTSPKPSGLMAFYTPGDRYCERVAAVIQRKSPPTLFRRNTPYPADPVAWPRVANVLRGPRTVLVELGFLTNPGDANALQDADVRQEIAACLVAGVQAAVELLPSFPQPQPKESA